MEQAPRQEGPTPLEVARTGLDAHELGEALRHAMDLARGGKPGPAETILLRVLDL